MNKRAQGLPISFIVIAAIAVIVLILILLFVIGGFRTEAVSSQTAANTCSSKCLSMQRAATALNTADYGRISIASYCTKMNIKGIGTDVSCDQIAPCTLEFKDGSVPVTCS